MMTEVLDRLVPLLDEDVVELPTVQSVLEQLTATALRLREIADEDWLRIPADLRSSILVIWSVQMRKLSQ